jgi:hypothetical protein
MTSPPYIDRSLEPVIRRAAKEFPAVILTGPRQSGKTTLLKHVFGETHGYVSLEPPDVRLAAANDPRGFLDAHEPPVIFDEVQYTPDLLPYIKERIDARRAVPGQYVLTGSQNLHLIERISESLAGRAAILKLLPLSHREIDRAPSTPLPWDSKSSPGRASDLSGGKLWESILRGGYPELNVQTERDKTLWHASYVQTYLERDVRTLRQVGDLSQFQNMLHALAARSAQLLNITDLARDIGVAVNTFKAWLSVLQATFQVILLRPYFANINKRLVKTPKVYFTDVGTLCYLVGLKDPAHAASGPMGGAILETLVISEITKTLLHRGIEPQIYFWRTSTGAEVDLLVETGGEIVPLEVKLSSTPKPSMAAGIHALRDDLGEKKVRPGYVVHPGNSRLPLGRGVMALPFCDL